MITLLIASDVTFKGNKDGLTIVLKETAAFEKILDDLSKKIAANKKFFKVDTLKIDFKGRNLTKDEEDKIIELINVKTGTTVQKMQNIVSKPAVIKNYNLGVDMNELALKSFCEGNTRFYKGTLRSGQSIRHDGNVVVLGDVNAGAEIICTGNIIVLGYVKGIVHAGSNGDENSIVAALGLQPLQLRISGIITRSPDEEPKILSPELAYIKDNNIFIESIDTRYKQH